MTNSINTNIAALYAQANIDAASNAAASSVARLSSGNAIVKASDNVAALAVGTSLQTVVGSLQTAQGNASQGTSLLQVADGALAQIQSILQQQNSVAQQAASGSLTDTDRGFLNEEFQALTNEIDSLASSTTFNGVNLINGQLSSSVAATTNTATAGSGSLTLNFGTTASNAVSGHTVIIDGITVTAKTSPSATGQFQVVADNIPATLDNLAAYLNGATTGTGGNSGATALTAAQNLKIGQANYSVQGNTLVITAEAGGTLGQQFTASDASSGTFTNTVASGSTANGGQTITTTNSLNFASASASVTGTIVPGAITLDSNTIYTVVSGDSLSSIVNGINAQTSTTGASAYLTGVSGAYKLNVRTANSGATGALAGTGLSSNPAAFHIQSLGGATGGLGAGSVVGVGSTGGSAASPSVLTNQVQANASSIISFPPIADSALTNSSNFGGNPDIIVGGVTFTFTTTSAGSTSENEIAIGSTEAATLDNAVAAINSYVGNPDQNYIFSQITASRQGNSIVISSNAPGNVLTDAGANVALSIPTTITGESLSNANLDNTSNGGITTNGVVNPDFIGTLSGLTATYVSANTVDLSVQVGNVTYTATNVSTTPSTNTTVRFSGPTQTDGSSLGGYFDIQLQASGGQTVSNASDASAYAASLNSAFSGVDFFQNRQISSFDTTNPGAGALNGATASLQNDDFSNLNISNINVTAPSGAITNASITFQIGGDTYTSLNPLGTQLGARSVTQFVDEANPNKILTFTNGGVALDLSSATAATAAQAALNAAFGVTANGSSSALSFQVGASTNNTIQVSIAGSTSADLGLSGLDVSTQAGATAAVTAVSNAINTVTATRASVGALESQFNFASAALQSSTQNEQSAASSLLDTDIAAESTNFATEQVKLQAGISVLAQANTQLQNLLKLLG